MRRPEIVQSSWLKAEVTAASIGAFVVGVICKQPELTVVGLGVGGVGTITLLSDFLNYLDWCEEKASVVASAEQILAEAIE
jgi:hypothetical protein